MNPSEALARPRFETPRIWSKVAHDYTERVLPAFLFYSQQALGKLPESGGRLLDLACGPGTFALSAAPRYQRVDAVDFSGDMLLELEQRKEELGLQNVEARQMDGHQLSFADAEFDAAASMFGVVHFAQPERGLKELFRVLKPGAPLVLSTWAPGSRSPFSQILTQTLKAVIDGLPDEEAIFHGGRSPQEWVSTIEGAGFTSVTTECVPLPMEIPEPSLFWQNMQRASVPIVLLEETTQEEEWQALSVKMLQALERNYDWPLKTHTAAHLFYARRP